MCGPKESQAQCYQCIFHQKNMTCEQMRGEWDPEFGDLTSITVDRWTYACGKFVPRIQEIDYNTYYDREG